MVVADVNAFLFWVALYTLLVTAIVAFFFFGDAPFLQRTPIPTCQKCVLDTVPNFITTRILPTICCGHDRAQRFTSFCLTAFEKYVMPLGYHLILAMGLALAQAQIIPHLPRLQFQQRGAACPASRFLCHNSTGLAFPPRAGPWVIPLYYVLALVLWLFVRFSDAGTINRDSYETLSRLYPFDNLLFHDNNHTCRTCHRVKPARSKHCSLCNRCVARFDHHCGWMASCIGLYNMRFFLLFLAFHSWILMHGSLASAEIVRASVQRLIRGGYVYTSTNTPVTKFTLKVAYAVEPTLFALSIAFGVASLFIAGFFGFSLYFVLKGMTTNESAKWDAVREAARNFADDNNGKDIWTALREELQDDPVACRQLPAFNEQGYPVHIYDRGYLANLSEILFPHSFVRKAIATSQLKKRT